MKRSRAKGNNLNVRDHMEKDFEENNFYHEAHDRPFKKKTGCRIEVRHDRLKVVISAI